MTVTAIREAPATKPPKAPELEDFLAEDYPESEQIAGPLNDGGIVIGAAGPGIGKTNWQIGLAYSLVSGRDFLGWRIPKKRSVLIVDGEMSGRQLQERFALYDFPDDREPLWVVNAITWGAQRGMAQPNLAEKDWQDTICEWAKGVDVVFLDNVMSLVNVPSTSFSSDEFWRSVTPLNLRLRAMGCTVIWLDHVNGEGMPFGTRTKLWLADVVFTLQESEKTPIYAERPGVAFTLVFKKVRGAKGAEHRDLDIEMCPDERGKAVWQVQTRKVAEQEWAADLQASGMTQRQIAEEMGISVGKVNKILKARVRDAAEATK